MAQVEETAAFDSPDAFALRVKHQKHIIFVPVEPSTSYVTLCTKTLSILAKSDAIPPEELQVSSFEEIDAEDTALFLGSTSPVGGIAQETLRFIELDRSKHSSISNMGLKDGPDAVVYLGFRAKGKKEYSQPIVSIPPLIEEEDEEEEDPDAIPPPLDEDEDAVMGDVSKGKARA